MIRSLILTFFITTTFLGCAKNQPQGGQDSGGGNTSVTTMEDVEFAYNKAKKHMPAVFNKFFDADTIINFKDQKKRHLLYSVAEKIIILGRKSIVPINQDGLIERTDIGYPLSRGIDTLLDSSEIQTRKDSSCSSKDKPHASASVKDFAIGSPICLSFFELLKLSKASLEREILSLLLHEYMHILGYEENDSVIIQNALLYNFDRIFPSGTKSFSQRHHYVYITTNSLLGSFANSFNKLKSKKTLETTKWYSLCSKMSALVYHVPQIQKEYTQRLTFLGPQLSETGDMSEKNIDELLNSIDVARANIASHALYVQQECWDSQSKEITPLIADSIDKTEKRILELINLLSEIDEKVSTYQ